MYFRAVPKGSSTLQPCDAVFDLQMGYGWALWGVYVPQAPCDDARPGAMPGGFKRRHKRHAVPGLAGCKCDS